MLQNVRLKILILNFLNDFSDLAEYDAMINASSAHLNIPPQTALFNNFFGKGQICKNNLNISRPTKLTLVKLSPEFKFIRYRDHVATHREKQKHSQMKKNMC